MTLTLAVFLNLTFGGLPRLSSLKNSSRTGALGITSRSSLSIPPESWLPWGMSKNPELTLFGVEVSCWDVEILSCSVSEGLSESEFPGLPVLMSCGSGYPVSLLTSGLPCCYWDASGAFSVLPSVGELFPEYSPGSSGCSGYFGSLTSSCSDHGD